MTKTATPSPSDRLALRSLCRAVLEAVEEDQAWPAPFTKLDDGDAADALVEMCQEVRTLDEERKRIAAALREACDIADQLYNHDRISPNPFDRIAALGRAP
jgi:hypothetical protein